LADEEDMTVILTIHQPGREIFCQLDDLLVVSWGGRPAYYGRTDRAVEYFEKVSGIKMNTTQNPAEFIVDFVRDPIVGKQTVTCFDAALVEDKLAFLRVPLADSDARRQPR
jgi:ABC-type multidrug transport system ATPase subunit